ncbi:MAG TPA: membrane protein insertase YidC [Candidatus Dormibacteraeota bacterium]|nr:membrane protein insertase YidC [Candidatus Dormibacteraeota bacterium]
MNDFQKKPKFTPELRILVASLLSMGVILIWVRFFAPKPPVQPPQTNPPAQSAPAAAGGTSSSPLPSAPTQKASTTGRPSSLTAAAATTTPPKAGAQEIAIVAENDLYRVEISNRGGVVKSWQLKKYKDDNKPQRVLDVVHPQSSEQTGGWPFALVLDDPEAEQFANTGLYVLDAAGSPGCAGPDQGSPQAATDAASGKITNHFSAPASFCLTWSDGHLEVTKHFSFDHSYVVRADTSVKLNGKPITAGLGWLGGFGDLTVTNPAPVETIETYYTEGGKITALPHKKLEGLDKWPRGVWQGGKDFTGIEDRYFTAAFLPANGTAPGTLETRYWKSFYNYKANGQDTSEPVPQIATATSAQPTALRVYVGPKDYDDLKKMNPPLHGLVNFGWLEFIADPLFHGLKWLNKYIPNWGWDIVVLTLVVNMLLFPLRISSYKTTLKMQRVAPEIKAIQDRFKKYKFNDPKKQEMNKEVMAVYQREGINPVGGCFQMFLQMPIWFGLNTTLRYAIELRHARWFGWITDLSLRDPYYVLPVTMGLSMYLVSKMTPITTTDPQQQMMMKIMPITMAGIFIVSPISSGLAVYILTSSLVGIIQQWYLNRTHPLPAAPAKLTKGKK